MLDPQSDSETHTQDGRYIGDQCPSKLIRSGRFHVYSSHGRRRATVATPGTSFDRCTPPRYSRVNRAITVPTTGDGSRATKIDSYSGLNAASSIVRPLIEATRFTT